MTDGPFKSMTRDPSGLPRSLRHLAYLEDAYAAPRNTTRCDKCGDLLVPGSWPFCNGRTGEHDRD